MCVSVCTHCLRTQIKLSRHKKDIKKRLCMGFWRSKQRKLMKNSMEMTEPISVCFDWANLFRNSGVCKRHRALRSDTWQSYFMSTQFSLLKRLHLTAIRKKLQNSKLLTETRACEWKVVKIPYSDGSLIYNTCTNFIASVLFARNDDEFDLAEFSLLLSWDSTGCGKIIIS